MGSHIVTALIRAGYPQIYGADDLSGGYLENIDDHIKSGEMKFYNVDLSKRDKTKNLISDIRSDIIFHLAANAREGTSFFQPLNIVERNYLAYINVLEPVIKFNLDKVILFLGDYNVPQPVHRMVVDVLPRKVVKYLDKNENERECEI